MSAITEEELSRIYHLACMAPYSPLDMEAFDRESISMAHKLHAVIHAQRTSIVAWQFNAAGTGLMLKRIFDAALAMRDAQIAYEQYGSNEDSATEAEAVFDGLLADVRVNLEEK